MLVIGYDDVAKCWIVKNSWGTKWGQAGYGRIGYGECDIDKYAKYALKGTNPDPWTKKRMHNGNMIESGNGSLHRNFEMLATANGTQIRHWWRDNNVAGFPGMGDRSFATMPPVPNLISTTFNRNFELCPSHHSKGGPSRYFDQIAAQWKMEASLGQQMLPVCLDLSKVITMPPAISR